MNRRLIVTLGSVALLLAATTAWAQHDATNAGIVQSDHPAISYLKIPTTDPGELLNQKLKSGEVTLKWDNKGGYLASLLKVHTFRQNVCRKQYVVLVSRLRTPILIKWAGRVWHELRQGAGVVVLEEYEHAKKRGAKIYAELAGYGMSADAGHMTAPNMDGPRRAMVNALRNAEVNADQVDYLNAHGTSTPLGDINETNAIKAALGDRAKKITVSSTKSMTGHLLGGAGGIESVFTVLALHHQKSPPTINIFNQDPECNLDYCANTARDMKIDVAVKNNFGFGGTNGTLVFKRI